MSLDQTAQQRRSRRDTPPAPVTDDQEWFFSLHAPQGATRGAHGVHAAQPAPSALRALRDLLWPSACSHHR
ncbi:hypothetical protein [Quadrisphaera granulorum]|uniref:hypothetical protein n=1 Tax=Quadrisphaera granulorum TaxID=317664 RepID=UPI000D6B66E9|nr:hypothetical protein [Quadrisphaera granulorum]